jgi:hypothetical protein
MDQTRTRKRNRDKGFFKNAAPAILHLGNSGVEPDVISVDAANCISPECEQFAEGKYQPLAILLNDAAASSCNNTVALLDQVVQREHRATLETLIFDLDVEGGFALEGLGAM